MSAGGILHDMAHTGLGIGMAATVPAAILVWVVYTFTKTNTLITLNWPICHMLLAALFYSLRVNAKAYPYLVESDIIHHYSKQRNVICLILIFVWGLRLGGYILFNRVMKGVNDPRYETLARNTMLGEPASSSGVGDGSSNYKKFTATPSAVAEGEEEEGQEMTMTPAAAASPAEHEHAAKDQVNRTKLRVVSSEQKACDEATTLPSAKRTTFFFFQFVGQAVMVVFPALPIYFIFGFSHPQQIEDQCWTFYVAIVIVVFGIVNSTIADFQLGQWRKKLQHEEQEKEKGQHQNDAETQTKTTVSNSKPLCREGWWKKSRHPNLFFEMVTWFGFAWLGVDDALNWVTLFSFVGPVLLVLTIVYVVTIPVTEAQMKLTRPDWEEQIEGTNMFLPF